VIPRCPSRVAVEELIAWERGELDPATEERIEEHVFACAACTRELEALHDLAAGIGGVVAAGGVPAAVTGDLIERAEERGLRLRSYRLAPGESVACTAAPEDHFVVLRLGVDVEEDESVDVIADFTDLETGTRETHVNEDVVVDRRLQEVVYLQPGAFVRSLPRSRWLVTARARGPEGERRLGPYTFDHTPWEQLAERR
jgi:hypothetical protein